MKHQLLCLSFCAVIAALLGTGLHAQSRNCGSHDRVVSFLAERYGEARQSIGLAANNSVVELFANLDTGSWTLTMTAPGEPTCLLASGIAHQQLAESLPNMDPPA